MVGTRSNWANILPVLNAFVSGEKVQVHTLKGTWEDTEEVYALSDTRYRIKPKNIISGVWTINFKYKKPLVTGEGALKIIGNSDDEPKWPIESSIEYIKESEKFTPFES